MTTQATLCYIFSSQGVLLQKKARGLFGEGRWNAPGGKVAAGETPERAAIREVHEETSLELGGIEKVGTLRFFLGSTLDQLVHVFTAHDFIGEPKDGREGVLKWFALNRLPYDEMWEDDRYWVPVLLRHRPFEGSFVFEQSYSRLVAFEMVYRNSVEARSSVR